MARSDFRFHVKKRVRYAEIDGQKVVFNSRYLEYFDIGATEYWRAAGIYDLLGAGQGLEFHVARSEVNYRTPILYDEEIDICVRIQRIGRTSLSIAFEIHSADQDDLRADGLLVNVHVNEAQGAATPVPEEFVAKFEAFEGRALRG